MGEYLDLDDVASGNPAAESELAELRENVRRYGAECERLRKCRIALQMVMDEPECLEGRPRTYEEVREALATPPPEINQVQRGVVQGPNGPTWYEKPASPPEGEPENWQAKAVSRSMIHPSQNTPEQTSYCPRCTQEMDRYSVTHCPSCDVSVGGPPPSEQAHGDALAAKLDRIAKAYPGNIDGAPESVAVYREWWQFIQDTAAEARQALTASGVPEGWKWQTLRDVTDEYITSLTAPDGTAVYVGDDDKAVAWLERLLSASGGVPYVPESIKRLPAHLRSLAEEEEYEANKLHGMDEESSVRMARAEAYRDAAGRIGVYLKDALASAPAVHRVPTDLAKRIIAARDAMIEGDDMEAWHQLYRIADPDCTQSKPWAELEQIAAAPTDGREYE